MRSQRNARVRPYANREAKTTTTPSLVTFGDSVPWGQGLLPKHKFSRLVYDELRRRDPTLTEHPLAHSGAVIGIGNTVAARPAHREVPLATPTIVEQVRSFSDNPRETRVVLINGGINDVDIRNILNPIVSRAELSRMITEYCYDSMRLLLEAAVQRFSDANTSVLVTGYYPILSADSAARRFGRMLLAHGVDPTPPGKMGEKRFFNLIVERCELFWRESSGALQQAVSAVRQQAPGRHVVFVDVPFTARNAVFASDPWLWGLGRGLAPQDEVVAPRRSACDIAYPSSSDRLAREQCYRASAGHPNVLGARQYAKAILEAVPVE